MHVTTMSYVIIMQSSMVIVQKAINTTVHGEWVLKYTESFARKKAFTLEKHFLLGLVLANMGEENV